MNPHHLSDIDPINVILLKIFRGKPSRNEVFTAFKPSVSRFALFESNIATCFEFSQQFSNGSLIHIAKLLCYGFVDDLDMIDFLFFHVVYLF